MRYYLACGSAAILAGLVVVVDRTDLAGTTATDGQVSIIVRNEPKEERLLVVGSIIGWIGVITITMGVLNLKQME